MFIALWFFVSFSITAQAPFPSADEIKQFVNSKTCVVLEANTMSVYNTYIRKAINGYWKITPFEFITSDDFESRRHDPAYSFILLTETKYEKDKSGTVYYFLNLLQGKNVEEIGKMPEVCAVPLAVAGVDDLEYGYKLGAVLSFIQNHALRISENPLLTGRRYLRFYNSYSPEVKKKVLLLRKEDLAPDVNTEEKIKAVYPGKFEIVGDEEIIRAVQEKAEGKLILHKVGPSENRASGICFKMLIGTDDAQMYYYNEHIISKTYPDGFLSSDFKRIAK